MELNEKSRAVLQAIAKDRKNARKRREPKLTTLEPCRNRALISVQIDDANLVEDLTSVADPADEGHGPAIGRKYARFWTRGRFVGQTRR